MVAKGLSLFRKRSEFNRELLAVTLKPFDSGSGDGKVSMNISNCDRVWQKDLRIFIAANVFDMINGGIS